MTVIKNATIQEFAYEVLCVLEKKLKVEGTSISGYFSSDGAIYIKAFNGVSSELEGLCKFYSAYRVTSRGVTYQADAIKGVFPTRFYGLHYCQEVYEAAVAAGFQSKETFSALHGATEERWGEPVAKHYFANFSPEEQEILLSFAKGENSCPVAASSAQIDGLLAPIQNFWYRPNKNSRVRELIRKLRKSDNPVIAKAAKGFDLRPNPEQIKFTDFILHTSLDVAEVEMSKIRATVFNDESRSFSSRYGYYTTSLYAGEHEFLEKRDAINWAIKCYIALHQVPLIAFN